MATRTRTTFAKRQKEHARQEKQRAKMERRLQKKLEPKTPAGEDESGEALPALPPPDNAAPWP